MANNDFNKKIYQTVKKIPKGKVSTYGIIACLAGNCRAPRAVGNALHKNFSPDIPCHRVIKSNGLIGGYRGNLEKKIRKLTQEGVIIKKDWTRPNQAKVELKKFIWP